MPDDPMQERRKQPSWYCAQCARTIDASQVIRQTWGASVAIICPNCQQRLGEMRYEQLPQDTDATSPQVE